MEVVQIAKARFTDSMPSSQTKQRHQNSKGKHLQHASEVTEGLKMPD